MESKLPAGRERRKLFRVVYPEEFRPVITIRGNAFKVLDISENGLRIANPDKTQMPGDIFQASMVLHDNEPFLIVGRVIRNTDDQVAIIMTLRGIPYRKIIFEQAFLRRQGD
jgi:hypothetical protein